LQNPESARSRALTRLGSAHRDFRLVDRYLGHTTLAVKVLHHEVSKLSRSCRCVDSMRHPRVAECQHKQMETMAQKVAEVRPVKLAS
jgi:hypothetical protein